VDVGEDQMNVRAGFENCNGRVGVVGEYHVIARFLQFDLEDVPDQKFIFDDQDSSHPPPPSFTRPEMDKSSNHWKGSIICNRSGRRDPRSAVLCIVCTSSELPETEFGARASPATLLNAMS